MTGSDSGTFPASEYLFSAPWTPLCHFDKLEGQREQPGDSANLSKKVSFQRGFARYLECLRS